MTTQQTASRALGSAALASLLNFGGKGGEFSAVGDVGGQRILFWSGSQIDAIQIGNNKYGGDGGSLSATSQIPADGKVYIAELQGDENGILCYIKMKIGEVDVVIGSSDHGAIVLATPNLAVRFAGISHGSRIDRLYFDIVR